MAQAATGLGLTRLLLAAWILTGCSQTVPVTTSPAADAAVTPPVVAPVVTPVVASPPAAAAPPSLQGSPPTTVIAGMAYAFEPTVSPSDTGVMFSIVNAPAWALFDTATGALGGTPALADVGITASIVISATSSAGSASLAPFAIIVTAPAATLPPATGTATLTWVAPILNTDGTALTTLAGYRIYYGTSATVLTPQISVVGAASTTYTINGLAAGTYYFAVTAYSTLGTESARSNVASKTI